MSTVIGHCVHEKKFEQPPKSRTVVLIPYEHAVGAVEKKRKNNVKN